MESVALKKPERTRWAAIAMGNDATLWDAHKWTPLLDALGANAVFFGYRGLKERSLLVEGYTQMIHYIEQQSDECLFYGYSFGGAIMREALVHHKLHPDKKYGVVTERSFRFMTDVARSSIASSGMCLAPVAAAITPAIITICGWRLGSVSVSDKLACEGVFEHVISATKDIIMTEKTRLPASRFARNHHLEGTHLSPLEMETVYSQINSDFKQERYRVEKSQRSRIEIALFILLGALALEEMIVGGLSFRFHHIPGGLGGGWKAGLLLGYGTALSLGTIAVFQKSKIKV